MPFAAASYPYGDATLPPLRHCRARAMLMPRARFDARRHEGV